MVNFTTPLDDTSPLIAYSSSDWHPGTVNTTLYYQGTYTFSNTSGATASFTFNGTGISIYGSTGPSNAPFSVQIDGGIPLSLTSTDSSAGFQVLLYSNENMPLDMHTITLKNGAVDPGASVLDLDYIMWQTQLGQSNDHLTSQVLQAEEAPPYNFVGSGWSPVSSKPSLLTAIGLVTANPGDSFSLTFNGTFNLSYQSSTHPDSTQYQVQVDDGPSYTYNSSNLNSQASQLLFSGSNYDQGPHVLKVTKSDPDNGKVLIIDHVETESSPGTSEGNSQGQQDTSVSSNSDGPSPALVGGLCAALVVSLIFFGVSLFLYRKRRKSNSSQFSEKGSPGKIEALYINVDEAVWSRSQSRHTHTRSNISLQSVGFPSASTSRTEIDDWRSSIRPKSPSRDPRSSNVSSSHNGRSSTSREQPSRRRRTLRNSRILRAGYNLFFASPGSSVSGSNLAPTTVLTTEISERPPTTHSPVSEAPPPLPPSNRSSRSTRPDSTQRLHVVNLSDE